MNHIASDYTAPDGTHYRSHAWELREGGYRRLALVLGYPFWPLSREKRLLRFLMDRGFRVHTLELPFGRADSSKKSVIALRAAVSAFAAGIRGRHELPLYIFASSFSAALVDPALKMLEGLACLGLIAPVLDYPPPGLKAPRCFLARLSSLELAREAFTGIPEALEGILDPKVPVLKFSRKDLRILSGERTADFLSSVGVPLAVFGGEDDPLLPASTRERMAATGTKNYAYPRVRHAPAYDRYADNFFADFGSFIDEVEAKSRR
jgi:alpha-beta hydrolase superfamily lysophospholipase